MIRSFQYSILSRALEEHREQQVLVMDVGPLKLLFESKTHQIEIASVTAGAMLH